MTLGLISISRDFDATTLVIRMGVTRALAAAGNNRRVIQLMRRAYRHFRICPSHDESGK